MVKVLVLMKSVKTLATVQEMTARITRSGHSIVIHVPLYESALAVKTATVKPNGVIEVVVKPDYVKVTRGTPASQDSMA